MIRAVIFDCFGVLATDGWLPYKRKYFSADPDLGVQAGELNHAFDAGHLSYEDFAREIAALAGVPVETARQQLRHNVPDDEVFEYIATLKPQYKIGMLSNAGSNWLNEIFTPEQNALFDTVVLSYETGFIKPEARAYETIAERLGVAPEECVLIDDQQRYVEGAAQVGMPAMLYVGLDELRADLPKLLNQSAK